jgi:hypothetical protein
MKSGGDVSRPFLLGADQVANKDDEEEEEISFEELRQLWLMMAEPDEDAPLVIGAFQNFLRSGCTEEQATNWLRKHRDEFPDNLRKRIDEFLRPVRTEEEILEIITRHESKKRAAARGNVGSDEPQPRSETEFMKRCEELHREGGVALQLPYMLKYGNLFR